MDFSNKDLRELIGSEFKGYKVQRTDQHSFLSGEKRRFLKLFKLNSNDVICAFDIDTEEFTARIDDDFDTSLEAVKDFRDRVLDMVAKKEAEQKKQSEMAKASNELNKALQNYFKTLQMIDELKEAMEG